MTGLLEVKEKLIKLYGKYEVLIQPLVKFLLAYIVLSILNGKLGYMTRIDNIAIVLIVSLMCSFLPVGCVVLFAALFSLLHMYALSLEVALVGVCLYLIMFLLFFRFSPKDSLLVILTPLFCALKIPYVIPLAAGLVCGPAAIVSVGCGVVVHYFLQTVIAVGPTVKTLGDDDMAAKLRLVIDGVMSNKEMLVVIASFAITLLVVYVIRRMSIDYAWTIAMVSGAMTNVIILLIGDLIYNINISFGGALLGSLVALVAAKVVEFFRFCVDYSRVERVQFEDDEYYYYVKAVPKMMVAAPTKTVKRINAQYVRGNERSVTTERTGARRQGSQGTRGEYRGGRSITVGNTDADNEMQDIADDYEELF